MELVKEFGQNFSEIQKRLPQKTLPQIRNFWMNNHKALNLKKLAPPGTLIENNRGKNSGRKSVHTESKLDPI